jgi:hypothetical protein
MLGLMLLLAQASAAAAEIPPEPDGEEIVVRGQREDEAGHRLGPPLPDPPPSVLGEQLRIDLGKGATARFMNRRGGEWSGPQIMFGVDIPF